jgi:hypothetical protein
VLLPWESIQEIVHLVPNGGGVLRTTMGHFHLPASIRDGEGLLRLIRGIAFGEPLLPPEQLPKPTWELLEEWFGPRDRRGRLRLNTNPNTALEALLKGWYLGGLLIVALSRSSTLGGGWVIVSGALLPLMAVCLLDRLRYPSLVLLDPDGVEFHYLLHKKRYAWSDFVGATSGELQTMRDPVAVAPPESITLQRGEPLSQRLVAFIRHLREAQEGVVLPPPDDAERSLVLASPEDAPPSGRELTEAEGERRTGSGRELEERPPRERG